MKNGYFLINGKEYIKNLEFRKCFNDYWSTGGVTQTDYNLSFDSMFRVLFKTLYIKDVLKRELTESEKTTYENLLNFFNNYDTDIEPFLPKDEWAMPLIERISDDINTVRFNHVFPDYCEHNIIPSDLLLSDKLLKYRF